MTVALKEKADKLAAGLTPMERMEFAEILMAGVTDFVSPDVARAWDREIKQRLADYRAGRVKTVSSKDIHTELQRKLNEIKARRISSRRAA